MNAKEFLQKNSLKEGESHQLVFWEDRPIDNKLSYKMVLKVIRSENAVKGDTVSNITKSVTVETGHQPSSAACNPGCPRPYTRTPSSK